ncbi:hypothetical protein [Crateriforma conspicua]|uniref:hypothetical protein n=1 Tax=Crateriforma TaxID=2714592 RepID=UPI0011B6512A|nr:hypothetical protein [Crateriforma conspicua]
MAIATSQRVVVSGLMGNPFDVRPNDRRGTALDDHPTTDGFLEASAAGFRNAAAVARQLRLCKE